MIKKNIGLLSLLIVVNLFITFVFVNVRGDIEMIKYIVYPWLVSIDCFMLVVLVSAWRT